MAESECFVRLSQRCVKFPDVEVGSWLLDSQNGGPVGTDAVTCEARRHDWSSNCCTSESCVDAFFGTGPPTADAAVGCRYAPRRAV